jgi:hypothetical protein
MREIYNTCSSQEMTSRFRNPVILSFKHHSQNRLDYTGVKIVQKIRTKDCSEVQNVLKDNSKMDLI